MPTVIDSLIVKLGLDTADFEKNKKTAHDGLDDLAKSALSMLAVFGGAYQLKAFVSDVIASSAALERLSQNLGISERAISSWGQGVEQAGGSSQGLQATLAMLSRAQTDLQLTGQSGLIPYFSALGVSMADANGKARNTTDILLDLSQRFQGLDRPTAFNMGRMMGIDEGTMNLLLRGRSEVELMISRNRDYLAVTKEQAQAAERFREQLTLSRQSVEQFGREIAFDGLPVLEKFLALFSKIGDWAINNRDFIETTLKVIGGGLVAIGLAVTPINLTLAAVLGLSAGIALLWDDYKVWRDGGQSFIAWDKWEPEFKAAKEHILELKKLIGDLMYRAAATGDFISGIKNGNIDQIKYAMSQMLAGNGEQAQAEQNKASGSVDDRTRQALSYFTGQGYSREQAAAIVGNLMRESSMNPAAEGDMRDGKYTSYGIAQWHDGRQDEFKKLFGKDIHGSSLEEQLAFLQYELTQGKFANVGSEIRQSSDVREASGIFTRKYEIPENAAREAVLRGEMSAGILSTMPATTNMNAAPVQSGNTTHVSIGDINIHADNATAENIAGSLADEIRTKLTTQVNAGLF